LKGFPHLDTCEICRRLVGRGTLLSSCLQKGSVWGIIKQVVAELGKDEGKEEGVHEGV